MAIFKAYDVRGIYKEEITIDLAYKIGAAFAQVRKPKNVVVGYDARIGSEELANALIDGFIDEGVDVIFIGFCSTPLLYFAINHYNTDGGVMVTASHNPKEYNGFKLCGRGAIPISENSGLVDIKKVVDTFHLSEHPAKKGNVSEEVPLLEYVKEMIPYAGGVEPMKVVIDCANGSMTKTIPPILENLELDAVIINEKPDGTFPAHSPNPMLKESIQQVTQVIQKEHCQIGILFDGDGDRIAFVDEKGKPIRQDTVLNIVGKYLADLHQSAKDVVAYDLKCSRAVHDKLVSYGYKPITTRVGHTFVKQAMRQKNALFGGESSGHYFYRDFYNADNSLITMFYVLSYFSQRMEPVSEIVKEFTAYYQSGEINVEVHDTVKVLARIESAFMNEKIDKRDGISVDCGEYWFNVRASNTEPVVRVNIEAKDEVVMRQRTDHILQIIKNL